MGGGNTAIKRGMNRRTPERMDSFFLSPLSMMSWLPICMYQDPAFWSRDSDRRQKKETSQTTSW